MTAAPEAATGLSATSAGPSATEPVVPPAPVSPAPVPRTEPTAEGRFAGTVVLVTGAGRGLGRTIAEAFAVEGATVVVAARTARYGERTVREFRERGLSASLVLGDLAERADVAKMFDEAVTRHGALDVVVHSAADNAQGLLAEIDDDTLDYLLRSNVHALHWITRAAVPHLRRSKLPGRMIFISSGAANRVFSPGLNAYGSTKAYLESFARGLAGELGPLGVRVNVVGPGLTVTERMLGHLTHAQADSLASTYPLGRAGLPEEIAAAVLFLASREASYITGASLLVDGGASMVPFPARGAMNDSTSH